MDGLIKHFNDITFKDLPVLADETSNGGLLQKLAHKGIQVPDGFSITAKAYREFLSENGLSLTLRNILRRLDVYNFSNLREVGIKSRAAMRSGFFPFPMQVTIGAAYDQLLERIGSSRGVVVRSSATLNGFPQASIAGHLECYLDIRNDDALLEACHKCYESLFSDRAIKYRAENGFDHLEVMMTVSVQQMVSADVECISV